MGKKKWIFLSIFLSIIIIIILYFFSAVIKNIIDSVLIPLSINWREFSKVFFYEQVSTVIFVIAVFIYILTVGPMFGIGYSYTKKNRLKGTLLWVLASIIFVLATEFLLIYLFLVVLFHPTIDPVFQAVFLFAYLTFGLPYLILFGEKSLDLGTYFRDLIKQRKIYHRLTYTVEKKNKLTYIHINTKGTNLQNINEAAPILKLQDALYEIRKGEKRPITQFLRHTFFSLIDLFTSHLSFWSAIKNYLFKKIGNVELEKNVYITNFSRLDHYLPELLTFEEGSGCGIGCKFVTHSGVNEDPFTFSFGPIRVGKYARIGAYSIIFPGVTIHEGAVIGGGSVVVDDIPPYTLAYGHPAKVIRKIPKESQPFSKKKDESS